MLSTSPLRHAARLAPVGFGVAGDDLLVGAPHDLQRLVVFVPEQPVEQGALPVGEGGAGLEQDPAGPVQRVLLRAAPAGGLLLEALPASGEPVAGEPDDVERVEDLPGMGHGCVASSSGVPLGVVTFCWTPVSLFFDYAMSPSSRLRLAMLVPKASLIRSSRYQRMYPSNCSTNPSMVTPVKLRPWKNSCLRCPKNPSAAALSGLQPFAPVDRVNPFSLQMLIHPGHR